MIVVTVDGIVKLVKPVQALKDCLPIVNNPFGNVTDVKPLQEYNTLSLSVVTPLGMTILASALQFEKAEEPIEVTVDGIVILLSDWHPSNKEAVIVVIPSGKFTDSKDVQPWKV